MIRVLLVDDETLIRSAMSQMIDLEQDIEVVGETSTGEQAITMAATLRPDVVLMDMQLPGIDGIEAATEVLSSTQVAVIMVTSHAKPGYLKRALAEGIQGFLPKTAPAASLHEAIRSVAAGGRYIDAELSTQAIVAGDSPLTCREADILDLAAVGASAEEIARKAHLSVGTVRNYLSSAVTKLNATNRHHAVTIARDNGWI